MINITSDKHVVISFLCCLRHVLVLRRKRGVVTCHVLTNTNVTNLVRISLSFHIIIFIADNMSSKEIKKKIKEAVVKKKSQVPDEWKEKLDFDDDPKYQT